MERRSKTIQNYKVDDPGSSGRESPQLQHTSSYLESKGFLTSRIAETPNDVGLGLVRRCTSGELVAE